MGRIVAIKFVDDGVNHDRLLVNSQGRISWDRDPIIWTTCQRAVLKKKG